MVIYPSHTFTAICTDVPTASAAGQVMFFPSHQLLIANQDLMPSISAATPCPAISSTLPISDLSITRPCCGLPRALTPVFALPGFRAGSARLLPLQVMHKPSRSDTEIGWLEFASA